MLVLPSLRNNTSEQSLATSCRRPSGRRSYPSRHEINRISRLRFEIYTFWIAFLLGSDSNRARNSWPVRRRILDDGYRYGTPSTSWTESPLGYNSSPEEVTRSSRTTAIALYSPRIEETSKTHSFYRYPRTFSERIGAGLVACATLSLSTECAASGFGVSK